MSVVTAYFDASGKPSDANPPSVFVAGFAATDEQWSTFQQEWDELLLAHEIRVPFHATDFFSGRQGFEAFRSAPELRHRVIADIVATLKRNAVASFSSGVHLALITEVASLYEMSRHDSFPFALCGLNAIGKVEKWLQQQTGASGIRYVFDDDDTHKGELIKICNSVAKTSKTRLPVHFEKRKGVAALQAADFLAWLSTRWTADAKNRIAAGARPGTVPPPAALRLIAEEIRSANWGIITRSDLIAHCERQGYPKRPT